MSSKSRRQNLIWSWTLFGVVLGIFVIIAFVLYFQQVAACEKKGGTLVRSAFSNTCVKEVHSWGNSVLG